MNPDRWRAAEEIFQQAADLSDGQRAAFLDDRCPNDPELRQMVEDLLAHWHSPDHAVAEAVGSAAAAWVSNVSDTFVGERIGPYRITGLIGQGGMGSVYRAVRDDEFTKDVAIKVVKRGMDTDAIVQRFRTERQILATLEHPNIARLHDGGTTEDGLPYFVMEYIDGRPITEFCHAGHLSIGRRLQLFRTVCEAVEHAHKNLIVHRDLKPTNILVTADATPKLLDFGIAKLLGPDLEAQSTWTVADMRVFTPDYGSPEQVRGERVATTTDVYSLGVVLYEMLTGVRAHRIEQYTPLAVEDAICRAEVPAASSVAPDPAVARELAGDLDNILAKALQKEPARRYQSTAALSDDIRCYLEHLPVQARPDTAFYRARKFARRHREILLATAAVFMALAIGGLVALRQAQVARARELQVRGLAKVFLFDVHDSIRDLPGATKARQTIVETAVRYLDALAGSHPTEPDLLQELAAGYMRVGDIRGNDERGANVGDLKAARASYEKALGLLDQMRTSGRADRQVFIERVMAQRQVAEIDARTVGAREAIASVAGAIGAAEELLTRYPDDAGARDLVGDVLLFAGLRQREAGDLASSLRTTTQALEIIGRRAAETPADVDVASALVSAESAVGMTQARLGDLAQAAAHYENAVAVGERLVRLDSRSVNRRRNLMLAYSHVGDVLGYPALPNLGDLAGAERAYRRMTELARQLYESDAQDTRSSMDYALSLMRLGSVIPDTRAAEKEEQLQRSSTLLGGLLDRMPDNLTVRMNAGFVEVDVANLLRDQGRQAQAATRYRRAIDITRPVLDSGNVSPMYTYTSAVRELARIEAGLQHGEAALRMVNEALVAAQHHAARQVDKNMVEPRVLLARMYGALSTVHAKVGNTAEATAWRTKALDLWKELSTLPGFTSVHRVEMARFEASLGP